MLAPVLWLMTRAVAYLARPILSLRYRIEIRGAEAIRVRGRRGILFLPNHSALVDPAVIVAWLYPSFGLRPLPDGGSRVIIRDARFSIGNGPGFGVIATVDLDKDRRPRPGPVQ